MRTTVTIDDDLFKTASESIGATERSVVLREGLKALIEREAAQRLARLGGSDPEAAVVPRRRTLPSGAKRRASS